MTRFVPSPLDDLRGRALRRLVPGLVHDVHNRTMPVRVSLELAAAGAEAEPHASLLASLDDGTELLCSLSFLASGEYPDGPVDLVAWARDFARFAAPVCRRNGVQLQLEAAPRWVVEGDAWSALVAFLGVLGEHVEPGAGPVRLWFEDGGDTVEAGLTLEACAPELVELARTTGVVQVGEAGDGLVLRARFAGAPYATEARAPARRASVLVLEPPDPFGALTEGVLREAGHRAVGATPDHADLDELLAEPWDLVLFDRRLERGHANLLGDLESADQRVRFLGEGGLELPFDPQALLTFVSGELASGPSTDDVAANRR